jgi:hypothetical protein
LHYLALLAQVAPLVLKAWRALAPQKSAASPVRLPIKEKEEVCSWIQRY